MGKVNDIIRAWELKNKKILEGPLKESSKYNNKNEKNKSRGKPGSKSHYISTKSLGFKFYNGFITYSYKGYEYNIKIKESNQDLNRRLKNESIILCVNKISGRLNNNSKKILIRKLKGFNKKPSRKKKKPGHKKNVANKKRLSANNSQKLKKTEFIKHNTNNLNIIFFDGRIKFKFEDNYYWETLKLSYPGLNKYRSRLNLPDTISIDVTNKKISSKSKMILNNKLNELIKNPNKVKKKRKESNKENRIRKNNIQHLEKKEAVSLRPQINPFNNNLIKSADWNSITFNNGFIEYTYQNRDFKIREKRSTYFLNWVKIIFKERRYSFEIQFLSGVPSFIQFSHDVFEHVTLGRIVFEQRQYEIIGHLSNSIINLNRLGLSFERLYRLLNIPKSFYLKYLSNLESISEKIVIIQEPIFQYKQVIKKDMSFLFLQIKLDKMVAIWESVHYDKATYIFYRDKDKAPTEELFIKYVSDFLCRKEPKKRYNLRTKSYNILGVKNYKGINHSYYSRKDSHWLHSMNTL